MVREEWERDLDACWLGRVGWVQYQLTGELFSILEGGDPLGHARMGNGGTVILVVHCSLCSPSLSKVTCSSASQPEKRKSDFWCSLQASHKQYHWRSQQEVGSHSHPNRSTVAHVVRMLSWISEPVFETQVLLVAGWAPIIRSSSSMGTRKELLWGHERSYYGRPPGNGDVTAFKPEAS